MSPARREIASACSGLPARLQEVWRESATSGSAMPGEPVLAERLAASRPAVREALIRLEERGYIRRRQGADTVINRRMLDITARIDEQIDRSELIASTGRAASMVVVDNHIDTPTAEESVQFEIPRTSTIMRTTKVWYADDEPVIRAHDCIVLRDASSATIDPAIPIFDIAAAVGTGPTEWEIVYPSATAVSARDATLLNLPKGKPALTMEVVGVSRSGLTSYWASELHSTNAFQHTMIRLVGRQ
ncbi:GntR family transcriptional regulator [uncultured Gordonia sp.]|uniref:GntR family transcriptional regulator n=1 Tax=uncultured Gordonia sp. TaxID=198437 RepID=UPI002583885F|nr:GntR family transcriptional regulator [uncultured Gordonia sp.]